MRWQEMAEIDVWSSELQLRAADKNNMVDEDDVHCAALCTLCFCCMQE